RKSEVGSKIEHYLRLPTSDYSVLAQLQSHGAEYLFDLVEGFAPEVARHQQFALGFLQQFPERLDVGIAQTIVGAHREFEMLYRNIKVFLLPEFDRTV